MIHRIVPRAAASVHPEVLEVMREVGLDLTGSTPQKLTDERVREIRDDVRGRVVELLRREGWARP